MTVLFFLCLLHISAHSQLRSLGGHNCLFFPSKEWERKYLYWNIGMTPYFAQQNPALKL